MGATLLGRAGWFWLVWLERNVIYGAAVARGQTTSWAILRYMSVLGRLGIL